MSDYSSKELEIEFQAVFAYVMDSSSLGQQSSNGSHDYKETLSHDVLLQKRITINAYIANIAKNP